MNNNSGNAAALRPPVPLSEAQLLEARAKAERRARLNARIRKERRILFPCFALAALAYFSLGTARVDGHSMEPTLHTGDTLIVWKSYHYFTDIKPGDLVVVKMKHGSIAGEEIVKRVVFVQNAAGNAKWPTILPEPRTPLDSHMFFAPYMDGRWTVPPKSIMVLGDNYDNSMDSRDFGPISPEEIDGKVINR